MAVSINFSFCLNRRAEPWSSSQLPSSHLQVAARVMQLMFLPSRTDCTRAPPTFALQPLQGRLAKSIRFVQTGGYSAGIPRKSRVPPQQSSAGAVPFLWAQKMLQIHPLQVASLCCNFTCFSRWGSWVGRDVVGRALVLAFFSFILWETQSSQTEDNNYPLSTWVTYFLPFLWQAHRPSATTRLPFRNNCYLYFPADSMCC